MTDRYRRGDRVRQELSPATIREGVVIHVTGDEITVQWNRGGWPQVLPPEQRTRFTKLPR